MPHPIFYTEMVFDITKTFAVTKTGKKRSPEHRTIKIDTSMVFIDDKIHNIEKLQKRLNLSPAESYKLKSYKKIKQLGYTVW